MNRNYFHRGRLVPGVYQRCQNRCPSSGCKMDHKWAYTVELPPDATGERRQVYDGGFSSGKDALDVRAEVLRKHREGLLPKDSKLTVAEWLRRWLTIQEEVRELRDGTMIDYRGHGEERGLGG